MKKSSVLYGIAKCKCPKCHQGKLFYNSNPYALSEILKMNQKCDHCGLFYENEPGFWTGALYVSYAIIVAVIVTCLVGLHVILDLPIEVVFPVALGIVFLGYPLLLRYSRVLYLYMFVSYDKNAN